MPDSKLAPRKKTVVTFTGWIGFSEGKPAFRNFADAYGDAVACDLFKARVSARERFQDVRKVTVTVVTA